MSAPWSVGEEAQRLCGCGGKIATICRCFSLAVGIRAGIEKAAEVAAKVGPMNQSDSLDAAARIRALLGTP